MVCFDEEKAEGLVTDLMKLPTARLRTVLPKLEELVKSIKASIAEGGHMDVVSASTPHFSGCTQNAV